MPEDFTKLIEDAVDTIDCITENEREDAATNGESGSMVVTLEDGRKFRVSYSRA